MNQSQSQEFVFVTEGARIPNPRRVNNPNITIPFPPQITPEELLKPKKNGIKSKTGNCFLIYRQVYVRELINQGHSYAMTDISRFISEEWKRAGPKVKTYYKTLAQNANKLHKQKFGEVLPAKPKKNKKEKKNHTKSLQNCKARNEPREQVEPSTPNVPIPSPPLSTPPSTSESYIYESLPPYNNNMDFPLTPLTLTCFVNEYAMDSYIPFPSYTKEEFYNPFEFSCSQDLQGITGI